jgi:hypothetical protein
MRCIRCNKPLKAYARQVETADGIVGWGPTCARLTFKQPKRTRAAPIMTRHQAGRVDPAQIDWIQQVAA